MSILDALKRKQRKEEKKKVAQQKYEHQKKVDFSKGITDFFKGKNVDFQNWVAAYLLQGDLGKAIQIANLGGQLNQFGVSLSNIMKGVAAQDEKIKKLENQVKALQGDLGSVRKK